LISIINNESICEGKRGNITKTKKAFEILLPTKHQDISIYLSSFFPVSFGKVAGTAALGGLEMPSTAIPLSSAGSTRRTEQHRIVINPA